MQVEVRLFATLAEGVRGVKVSEPFDVELPDSATVGALIEQLGIDPGDVHLVMIDGRVVHDRNRPLAGALRVGLFPPVGGG